MAATALDLVEAHCPRECSRYNFDGRSRGDNALTIDEHPPVRGEEPASQWILVDELDSGLSGRDPGRTVEWIGCHRRAEGESEQARGVRSTRCGWAHHREGCSICFLLAADIDVGEDIERMYRCAHI